MLYTVTKKGGILLHPEALKLVPEFAKLDSKQVLFLILANDYDGPFKQFPEDDRVRKAKRRVYGTDAVSPETMPVMLQAIKMYNVLQYDRNRELQKTYEKKIDKLSKKMETEEDESKLKKIDDAIQMLTRRITEVQRVIETDDEERLIKGGGRISLIEQWGENMRNEAKKVKADPDATTEI